MSAFTDRCAHQIGAATKAAATTPRWLRQQRLQARQERTLGTRAGLGCLTLLIVGPIVYLFVPLLVIIAAETAIAAWIILLAALWAIGTAIDTITRRKTPPAS